MLAAYIVAAAALLDNCPTYNQSQCVARSSPAGKECCGWSKYNVCQSCPSRLQLHASAEKIKCGVATTQFAQNTPTLEAAVQSGKLSKPAGLELCRSRGFTHCLL